MGMPFLFHLVTHLFFAQAADVAPPALTFSVKQIQGGQSALVKVSDPTAARPDLQLKVGDNPITLFKCIDAKSDERCGFVAAPSDAKNGMLTVETSWGAADARETGSVELPVVEGKFRESIIKVDPGKAKPSPEDQARIERDMQDIKAAYATPSPEPLWDGPFRMPSSNKVTSKFGGRRKFNGEVKSIHQGVDLKAGMKTPIYAANAGKVVLAKELFLSGNLVILDHGGGLFSSYAHLSVIKVALGQLVKKGEKLGLAGNTGRVTGPHLHWAMRVNGTPADPLQLKTLFNGMYRDHS
jgi:hypothetical protein